MVRKVVILSIVVIVSGVIFWNDREHPPVKSDSGVLEFSVTDVDGHKINSEDLRGKVILVDFWATWCAPCRAEIPQLARMQETYGPKGLQVIGLSMDDTVAQVRAYLQQQTVPYPVAMADQRTVRAFGGVLGLPVNIVVGRDGRLWSRRAGTNDVQVLEQDVEKALTAH